MASSRVMASASTSARSDQSPLYPVGHLAGDRRGGSLGSMNMEELLRNFYADTPAGGAAGEIAPGVDAGARAGEKGGDGKGDGGGGEVAPPPRQESYSAARRAGGKTAEEVWKEISGERKVEGGAEPGYKEEGFGEITLEAFLARAGAVTEEEVRVAPVAMQPQLESPVLGFVVDPAMADRYAPPQQQQHILHVDGSLAGFGGSGVESGAGGRGKRRPVEDPEDRAAQQKQRRMIKNRESAARSRERKQAYILELEASVTRLEEENARLVRELEQQEKARLKQLMENLVPVAEKRRLPRSLRRTCSAQW